MEQVWFLLTGGGLVVLGMVLGRLPGLRRPAAPDYRCTCGHPLSLHGADDDEDPSCNGGRFAHINNVQQWVECRCLHYVGERPPPDLETLMRQSPLALPAEREGES